MSHVSEDEKAKDKLKEWLAFNDSKESNPPKTDDKNKGKTWTEKDDDGTEYETNDLETADSEW